MRQLPSRLRRLDDALADLPLDEPMLLTELDGFLTGILVGHDLILPGEWLPIVWGAEEIGPAPFEDPADVQWFTDAITARYNEIARDLGRGKPQPIFDIDERNGDVLWELWIDGFAQAIELRPEGWAAMSDSDDETVAAASRYLSMLIAIARDESALDSVEINAIDEGAASGIAANTARLYEARLRRPDTALAATTERSVKVGRNDPCPCGSARKFKRCCG